MPTTKKRAPVKSAPSGTAKTIGRGNANRQAAKQKAKVQESADKLSALKARQAEEQAKVEEARARLETERALHDVTPAANKADRLNQSRVEKAALKAWEESGRDGERPSTPNLDAILVEYADANAKDAAALEAGRAALAKPRPAKQAAAKKQAAAPAQAKVAQTVHFTVDGKLVGSSQNTLSHIARVTGGKDSARWPASQLRSWLAEQGVAEPLTTEFSVTLPNGRVLGAVKAEALAS